MNFESPVPMLLVRYLDGTECWEPAAEYRRNPGYGTFVIRSRKGTPVPSVTMPPAALPSPSAVDVYRQMLQDAAKRMAGAYQVFFENKPRGTTGEG